MKSREAMRAERRRGEGAAAAGAGSGPEALGARGAASEEASGGQGSPWDI